jgi:hypothetical protein
VITPESSAQDPLQRIAKGGLSEDEPLFLQA